MLGPSDLSDCTPFSQAGLGLFFSPSVVSWDLASLSEGSFIIPSW